MDAGGWSETKADRRVVASQLLLEGLHSLGLDVANVTGRDLVLGAETLASMRERWPETFVSANIDQDGEPLFATHTIVERDLDGRRVRIGITGVTLPSRAAGESWEDGELDFRDPLQAARHMAEQLQPQTDLRILLANLAVSDLENFVAEFPDAYQFVVAGNGELRATTPLGAPPLVLAPGTSGKHLAWVNIVPAAEGFEVSTGNSLNLDDKIRDDPETASLVADLDHRLREHLQRRRSSTAAQETGAVAAPATSQNP